MTTIAPPRSFLRWAGSKRRLIPHLAAQCPDAPARYVEPFVGSGALFFHLQPAAAVLGDLNRELMLTYACVRDHPEAVHTALTRIRRGSRSYYKLRATNPRHLAPLDQAARFIFLNRFCFNGLYRTNRAGVFNVPYGRSRTGRLPTPEDLVSAAALLKHCRLFCGDFEVLVRAVLRPGDLVYLDPPYVLPNARRFQHYGADSFCLADLPRLAALLDHVASRGAWFLLSYADCPEARKAFRHWHFEEVVTHRNIAGFADRRRSAQELIVSNVPVRPQRRGSKA